MSKGLFIVSKASTAIAFVEYNPAPFNGIPTVKRRIVIKGGANVAQPKTFITPKGVVTRVTQDEYDFLMKDAKFINFMSKGFMAIIGDEHDVDNAARDMTPKDKSAPRTPADYANSEKISVGAAKAA